MKRICCEPGCTKKALKLRKRCGHHHNQRYRDKSPIRYIYMNLKHNAKKRGKQFNLSLEELTAFLLGHPEYMANKGRVNGSLQIDRIYNWLPYQVGNLQILTKQENLYKYYQVDRAAEHDMEQHLIEEEYPF